MRTFIVMTLLMAFSLEAFAQTRVRENIKQKSGTVSQPVKVKGPRK